MKESLQWGGRFGAPPDAALLQFGSSLEEDLVLAPFDVQCSKAHVIALREGGILTREQARELTAALETVESEIASGAFQAFARAANAEDVHGAIDARVREVAPSAGESLHAGRSRNDQVATTLLLYCAQRANELLQLLLQIATEICGKAESELAAGTFVAGTTHWQPAQPLLLAFWLVAGAEPFLRSAHAMKRIAEDARASCPLGSGALAGSSLPLVREAAAAALGFGRPSRNAMDAIGNRDVGLDLAHACVRSVLNASRLCEEFILWCTPAFGYARLGDAASTGSSLMPQKRNPDPFELVRGNAADLTGRLVGALSTVSGIGLSYHRDLQITKAGVLAVVERSHAALQAFATALVHLEFQRGRMNAMASESYTIATDIADALIARGVTARKAHAAVGTAVSKAESEGRPLDASDLAAIGLQAGVSDFRAPLTAAESVLAKKTSGSTSQEAVRSALDEMKREIAELRG